MDHKCFVLGPACEEMQSTIIILPWGYKLNIKNNLRIVASKLRPRGSCRIREHDSHTSNLQTRPPVGLWLIRL